MLEAHGDVVQALNGPARRVKSYNQLFLANFGEPLLDHVADDLSGQRGA